MATKGSPNKPRNSAGFVDSLLTSLNETPAVPEPVRQTRSVATPMAEEIGRAGGAAFQRLAELERQIKDDRASGRTIVEIDPSAIRRARFTDRDPSFINDQPFAELCRSIEEEGQLIPVAVREIPGEKTAYETVWGHRRIAACLKLARNVRAIILQQDDLRAAVFGYTENAKRASTSLIEQGRYFAALISEALFVNQADLAKALQISEGQVSGALRVADIPDEILDAIGEWRRCTVRQAEALRKAIDVPDGLERIRAILPKVKESGGTVRDRVESICSAVRSPTKRPSSRTHTDGAGRTYIALQTDRFGVSCRFPKTTEPEFIEYIWQRVPELRTEFENSRSQPSDNVTPNSSS
jgi:ParB family chromosome partitioning protein